MRKQLPDLCISEHAFSRTQGTAARLVIVKGAPMPAAYSKQIHSAIGLRDHIATVLSRIPEAMRVPAYTPAQLARLLKRGTLPIAAKQLAAILPSLGWHKHRVWRPNAAGRRHLVTLWVAPDAKVTRNGIRLS